MRILRPFESNRLSACQSRPQERKVKGKFMSIQEVSAERFAQLFHHYHQALSDDSGNASYLRTKDAWESVPSPEKPD